MYPSLVKLIHSSSFHCQALDALCKVGLPGAWIGAGFIRNLVWDKTHYFESPTPLNDVDVIYFAPQGVPEDEKHWQRKLEKSFPLPCGVWQVKNQGRMHEKHGHSPYNNLHHALSFWPEQETAVAVRRTSHGHIEILSVFGLECLFKRTITRNPAVSVETFMQRVTMKKWQTTWPSLTVKI